LSFRRFNLPTLTVTQWPDLRPPPTATAYGFVDLTPGVYRISSGGVVTSTMIRAGVVSTVTLRLER
jgi:hypothetical protein